MINALRVKQNGCHFADYIFEGIFINDNVWITIKIYSFGSSSWQVNIGSGNSLAPNWRQAITWTNDDPGRWCIYTFAGLNGLMSGLNWCCLAVEFLEE